VYTKLEHLYRGIHKIIKLMNYLFLLSSLAVCSTYDTYIHYCYKFGSWNTPTCRQFCAYWWLHDRFSPWICFTGTTPVWLVREPIASTRKKTQIKIHGISVGSVYNSIKFVHSRVSFSSCPLHCLQSLRALYIVCSTSIL
jgi:hypothetical protein